MPRKNSTPPVDPHAVNAASYNDVVGRTEVRGIRLLDSRFEIKPEAIEIDPSAWRKIVSIDLIDVVSSAEIGRLYGVLQFEIACRHGRKRVLNAAAKYLVSYEVDGGCSEEDGRVFVDRVGRVAAYPYFRSLFATLVAEAGLQMPPLPILSVAPRSVASALQLTEISAKPDALQKP